MWLFWLYAILPSSSCCPPSLLSSFSFSWSSASSSMMWVTSTLCTLGNEDLGTLAEYDPLTLLAHVYLGCIQRECKPNETIIEQFRKKLMWVRYICWSNWEIARMWQTLRKNFIVLHDMEWHAWKCVDRYCELANKKTEQLYKVSHPCLDDHQFKHSSRKNSNQWRIVRSLLTNCLDMLVLGTNWKARHSVVGQQTCSISHYMDRSMWRTLGSFDFIHSSRDYRQHCHVGNSAQHCRLGLCQDSDFAGRSWGFKNLREESCASLEVEHMF